MPQFVDVPFDAAMFHSDNPGSWPWAVAPENVMYYRVAVDDGLCTVQVYVEQGNVVGDDGSGYLGPTCLCVDLPAGVTIAAFAQQHLHYTDDENYVAFPNDGLVIANPGQTLTFKHVGDGSNPPGPNSGRWVPGTSAAFWTTFTFPIVVV